MYELDHGESMQFCKGKLEITGTIGAALSHLTLIWISVGSGL